MRYELHFSRSGGLMGVLDFESMEEVKTAWSFFLLLGYTVTVIDNESSNIVKGAN